MGSSMFDLKGKVALVTGGNGGIGLGMALAMAEAGAGVCIWGTNPAKNAAALEALQATGSQVAAMRCDVSDEAQVERCFAATLEQFGRVDGCFANAGIGGGTKDGFLSLTLEQWRAIMAVNLDGAFLTFRAAARHMVERAKAGDAFGRLVATSSTSALMGAARNEHYGSSKSALTGLVKGLAVEFARYGITANTIQPGWIDTEMTALSKSNPKFVERVIGRVPMRRWGRGDEFGGIAVYLLSEASGFHTGDEILIDGGYVNF